MAKMEMPHKKAWTGWLGREDSNLRMAESKSNCFAFEIKARSEKSLKTEPISINYLVGLSEFMVSDRTLHMSNSLNDAFGLSPDVSTRFDCCDRRWRESKCFA
jgi:hypothetical protein